MRKHWDDPPRAAAEQAAAKVASEEGIAATSETARAAARRAAAAAARLVDAELLLLDGDSPEGRSLEKPRAKRAYLGDVAAALRDPVGFAALPPTGSTSTREKTDRAGSNPTTARPATKAKISTTAKVSTTTSTAISRANSPSSTPRTPARHLAGLARRSLALRSLASRVGSHLALATETTACDVRVGVVRPPRIPPLVFLLRAPRPPRTIRTRTGPSRADGFCAAVTAVRAWRAVEASRRWRNSRTRNTPLVCVDRSRRRRVPRWRRRARNSARGGACRPRARARETRGGGGGEGGGGGARGAPIRSKETARVCGAGASIRRAGLRARIHRRRVTRQRGASTVGREAPSRREPTRVLLETPLGAPSAREAAPSSGFRPRRVHSERRARVPRRAGSARVHANRARARRERRRRAIRGGAQTRGDGTLAGVRAISTGRRDDVARVDA